MKILILAFALLGGATAFADTSLNDEEHPAQVDEGAFAEAAPQVLGQPTSYRMWYCQAQSYATGLWYYWYSYNLAYARAMVVNACVAENGYTCNYRCW